MRRGRGVRLLVRGLLLGGPQVRLDEVDVRIGLGDDERDLRFGVAEEARRLVGDGAGKGERREDEGDAEGRAGGHGLHSCGPERNVDK